MSLAFPKPTRRLKSQPKRVASKSKRPSAKDRATADRLCAALVKQRAGSKCEAAVSVWTVRCLGVLDWAHGFARRNLSIRWAHANTWALCRGHHAYFTANPSAWWYWRISQSGPGVIDEVVRRENDHVRVDMAQVIADLKRGVTQLERA